MKNRMGAALLFGAGSLGLLVPGARAQNAQGTILGHITDASGAEIAGVKLTLVNTKTQVKQDATSSSVGDYVFVNITPGSYTLTTELHGFRSETTDKLNLGVD